MQPLNRKAQKVPEDFYTDLPVGEILRRARLQYGLSISEAAQYLYIRQDYLEALEKSDFDALPGRVYVIGFIRTYAEFLDLDGNRVVNLLKRQSRGLGTPQSLNIHLLPTERRLPGVPVVAVSFASLLLVLTLWIGYQNARIGVTQDRIEDPKKADVITIVEKEAKKTEPSLVVPGPQQEVKAVSEPAKEPVPAVQIILLEESWIEMRSPEGRVIEARVFRKGEHFDIVNPVDEFGHAFSITMGNAAGVQILLKGKAVPPLGGVNKVRRNVSLDPKTLQSLVPE